MCTLLFLYKVFNSYPIVALHNRYMPIGTQELYPQVINLRYRVYCPIDLGVRGTWIGFNDKGLFIAVTDQHTGSVGNPVKSRGILILNALGSCGNASEAKEYIVNELTEGGYRKGNFIIADENYAYHIIYDDTIIVRELEPGPHVSTNLTPLPNMKISEKIREIAIHAEKRGRRALELARGLIKSLGANPDPEKIIESFKTIAKDHAYGETMDSICLHDSYWTTSSSTIILLNTKNMKKSRILYCYGYPCKGRFSDYSNIIG